ncbi:hypothetical protein CDEST_15401 [Colletotrichum destructivum]|uniref:Uncharacterized protein n=1 Tax=Colletotrichum destructivum TaxID=34406 RepID=A0AAX4J4S7_9PEZI|nr:hypothetical protein CDEST_15401 [Colletotrichum destructivum]
MSLTVYPHRRQCHQQSTPSQWPQPAAKSPPCLSRREKDVAFASPDEGSLRDLIVKNPRLRLFVKPKCWTHFHLDYLGVRFNDLTPCDNPAPPTSSQDTSPSYHRVPTKSALDLSNALTNMLGGETEEQRTKWIRTAMSQLYRGQLSCSKTTGLHHYFGHRAYLNSCQAQVIWEATPSRSHCITSRESTPARTAGTSGVFTRPKAGRVITSSQPILAYVDTRAVDAARRNTSRVERHHTSVQELNEQCCKTYAPLNALQGPFLAGVILALAQRPFYDEPMPPATKSHNSITISSLGVVTEALLRKFYHPTENPQPTGEADGMRIEYTRVPIWPILGLEERLGKALGRDITWNFSKDNMKTWFVDVESNNGRNKRPNDGDVQNWRDDGSHRRKKQAKSTKALFANERPVI